LCLRQLLGCCKALLDDFELLGFDSRSILLERRHLLDQPLVDQLCEDPADAQRGGIGHANAGAKPALKKLQPGKNIERTQRAQSEPARCAHSQINQLPSSKLAACLADIVLDATTESAIDARREGRVGAYSQQHTHTSRHRVSSQALQRAANAM